MFDTVTYIFHIGGGLGIEKVNKYIENTRARDGLEHTREKEKKKKEINRTMGGEGVKQN